MSILSNEEKETLISFDETPALAFVEVPVGTRLHKRLSALGQKPVRESTMEGQVVALEYEIPKKWIKINAPRSMTDEQKTKQALVLQGYRDKMKSDPN